MTLFKNSKVLYKLQSILPYRIPFTSMYKVMGYSGNFSNFMGY